MNDTKKVTRVEVIDKNGRSYSNWNENNRVELSYQDNNKTLKIFIKELPVNRGDNFFVLEYKLGETIYNYRSGRYWISRKYSSDIQLRPFYDADRAVNIGAIIYKAKRLSDNKIFKIKDTVLYSTFGVEISNFEVVRGVIEAYSSQTVPLQFDTMKKGKPYKKK